MPGALLSRLTDEVVRLALEQQEVLPSLLADALAAHRARARARRRGAHHTCRAEQAGADEMGWDGMGWDGMGWDGLGWGGVQVRSTCLATR